MKTIRNFYCPVLNTKTPNLKPYRLQKEITSISQSMSTSSSEGFLFTLQTNKTTIPAELLFEKFFAKLPDSDKLVVLRFMNIGLCYKDLKLTKSDNYRNLIIMLLAKYPNLILTHIDNEDLFLLQDLLQSQNHDVMIASNFSVTRLNDHPDFIFFDSPEYNEEDIAFLLNNNQRAIIGGIQKDPWYNGSLKWVLENSTNHDNLYIASSNPPSVRKLEKRIDA